MVTFVSQLKKLLIISYYWPPAGGPGVQRWVKLCKYLAQEGYQCHVITVDEKHASYPALDHTLGKDLGPSVKVTKTRSFEALKIFSKLFKKENVPYAGIPDKNKMSTVGRAALYIRSNFFIPDARIGWNKYALSACKELLQKERFDAIITTSPPHSTQLVGLALKKQYPHIPWVADLRDPWTDMYYYDKLSHSHKAKQRDKQLETEVLIKADAICTVSAEIKRMFAAKSPEIRSEKILVLPNGFDEEDFEPGTLAHNPVFTIAHTGTINSNYTISGFIDAVQKFAAGRQVKVKFIGNVDPAIKTQLKAGIGDLTEFVPYVPHSEITLQMQKADMLLLAIPDNKHNKGILTGKLFEYLAAQKPILGIGPTDGDAAGIVNECHAGNIFGYSDSEAMQQYLSLHYEKWKNEESTTLVGETYRKYSRKELARKFADLIQKLA